MRLDSSRGIALHHILYAVIALAVVAFLVSRVVSGGREAEPAASETATESAPPPDRNPTLMDPALYRADIERIEGILYGKSTAATGDANEVSRAAMVLSTHLMTAPNKIQGSIAGRRVMAFSNRVGREEDAGTTTLDLARARREWEATRDSTFQPAPWFRSGAGN